MEKAERKEKKRLIILSIPAPGVFKFAAALQAASEEEPAF